MGIFQKFFGDKTRTLKLECPRCGQIYHVGDDAGIMTMDYVFKDIASRGSSVASPPAGPDLITSINCDTQRENNKAKKAARKILSQIRHDLKRRTWYCMKCMNNDNPYKYPNT
jgi:hypothetical protein